MKPKFELGETVITRNAAERLVSHDVLLALHRHASGDWGDCGVEDQKHNDFSLDNHLRLMSVYHDSNQNKFYVITEHDRSATTVLLPDDY